ncbi:transposase [Accumulibacter sp.]|uniref:transposase n=1 Tax=Accumulibacter sp. TaxID=2053492 RepID=UPI0028C42DC8|nr:transposase [Accumulibacter sp.]
MNETKKALRLIVVKYKRQAELFDDDAPRYHVIISNRVDSTADTLIWYRWRGETSGNGIRELKIGFRMERMPCGQFAANATFFRIGVIAHTPFVLFKQAAQGADWLSHKVATVRWHLFHLLGKVVRHAGAWVLKIAANSLDLFRTLRTHRFAQAVASSP